MAILDAVICCSSYDVEYVCYLQLPVCRGYNKMRRVTMMGLRSHCRNPQQADIFLSASGDCTLKIWDIRQPQPTLTIAAHPLEVLAADWCKYNDCIVATGSVDKSIKVWDVRMPRSELAMLLGHTYAVRKLAFSPWAETVVASCSYDMTVRLWDYLVPENALVKLWDHHTEFAVGLDWSSLHEGLLASCGWDQMVWTWHQNGDPRG